MPILAGRSGAEQGFFHGIAPTWQHHRLIKTDLLHGSIGLASQTGRAETVLATKPFVCVHLVVVSDVLVGGACSVTGLDVQRKPVSLSGLNRVGKGT